MKIKNSMFLCASIFMFSSFFVNAQGSLYLKGATGTKEVQGESIYLKSEDKTSVVKINKITVTNGTKDVIIEDNNGDNENNQGGETVKIGYVTAVEGLNVRTGPSTSFELLGALSYKASMEIVETIGDWYKIKYGNGYGYVYGAYVSTDANETPLPDTKPTTIKKVVIDPGHGGSDPGAIGKNGLQEKDVVLDVSLKLRDILKSKGYSVVMTRSTDVYLTLQQRVDISNKSGADYFVSVHTNSFSTEIPNGTETFAYRSTGFASDVARKIQSEMIKDLGLFNRGFKTEAFYVLRYNNIPAALVEIAFISNLNEESLLATDAFRTKSAHAIANGIMAFN